MRRVAVILALVVMAACGRDQPPPLPDVIPLMPAGRIERVVEFTWTSSLPDARYRLNVTDPGGVPILRRETADQRVLIERTEAGMFPTGGYAWYVEALDANGEVIATSRTQLFDVD